MHLILVFLELSFPMTLAKKSSKLWGNLAQPQASLQIQDSNRAAKANMHSIFNFTTQLTKLWSYPTYVLQFCSWLNPISNSLPHEVFLFWGNRAPQGLHSYIYHPSNSDQICIVDLHGNYFCIFGGLEGFGGLVFYYLHMAVSLCYPKHNYLRITYIIMKVTPWCEKCIFLRW